MPANIELAKTRDFGEIINDTFIFIRQNLKPLLKCFFTFCGIFLVASALTTIVQQSKIMGLMNSVSAETPPTFGSNFSDMWLYQVINIVVILLSGCATMVTVLSYICIYKQKGNMPATTEEVWGFFKYYFLRLTGSAFLTWILLIVAFFLCIIPGVWLFPIFALIFPIMVMENGTYGHSFNRSFVLIKNNWWVTAGTILVIYIIVYVLMMLITLPASAANLVSLITRPGNRQPLTLGGIIFSSILQQFAQVLMVIPAITYALCYFNLVESKEGTSLLDRINKFGTGEAQNHLPEEEY